MMDVDRPVNVIDVDRPVNVMDVDRPVNVMMDVDRPAAALRRKILKVNH